MNYVKDSIGWAYYTWNPITGCKRGCYYCYARRNWNRLHRKRTGIEFNEVAVYPERFEDPDLWRKPPSRVFVGSMSDPEYWSDDEFRRVLDTCKTYRQHIYMFLTKGPHTYRRIKSWPVNTMQGATLTGAEPAKIQREIISELMKTPNPFVSIEPLLGFIHAKLGGMERIIVGAMTGPGSNEFEPVRDWINSVKLGVNQNVIYWKKNIQRYL